MRVTTSMLVALGWLLLSGTASAFPDPPPPGVVMARIAKVVGLSNKQVKRIKAISFKAGRQAIGAKAKLQMVQMSLHEAMTAEKTPSERKVMEMVTQIGHFETELKKIHVLKILRIRKTMSLKQWRKMEALHAKHKLSKDRERPPRP